MGGDSQRSGRRVSLKDIALHTGFSVATVSRSLSEQGRISDETRQAVLEAAEQLGYIPNLLARDLRRSNSRFVGFMVPDIRNPTYSVAAEEFSYRVSQAGFRMLLAVTGDDPEREYAELAALVGAQAAGIVITPTTDPLTGTRQLLQSLPTVEFNRSVDLSPWGVYVDDEVALARAVEHLAGEGQRDIALISTGGTASNSVNRLKGYRKGLRAAGLPQRKQLVRLVETTRMAGYAAAMDLLLGPEPPSALIVAANELSIGVSRALADMPRERSLSTAIVLYGDPEWTGTFYPICPTIAVPKEAMAQAAADMILDAIQEPESSPLLGRVYFDPDLRQRTAPPTVVKVDPDSLARARVHSRSS